MRQLPLLCLCLLLAACAAPSRPSATPAIEQGGIELLQRRIATLEQGVVTLQRQLDEQATLLANLDRQFSGLASQTSAGETKGVKEAVEAPTAEQRLLDERNRQAARDYLAAFTDLTTGRYSEAASGFRQFMETYPENQYAGNALFWLGESQLAQRELTSAADTFRQVYERYPQANKAAEALLKLATVHRQLGQNEQAMQALSLLQMNYPESPAAKRAGAIFN